MVIHTAVDDKEFLAARDLDVSDANHVDAGFTGQEASRLEEELRSVKPRIAIHF